MSDGSVTVLPDRVGWLGLCGLGAIQVSFTWILLMSLRDTCLRMIEIWVTQGSKLQGLLTLSKPTDDAQLFTSRLERLE